MKRHIFEYVSICESLKKVIVDPLSKVPYWILFCEARSSTLSMGVIMRSTVRKAAKLAVYEEMRISVKNHQMAPIIRVDVAFGFRSQPFKIQIDGQNDFIYPLLCDCSQKCEIEFEITFGGRTRTQLSIAFNRFWANIETYQ